MYTSSFATSSNGACIDSIGTPMSTVSTSFFETYFATVPPPPWSTLPSSPVYQATPASSRMSVTKAISSAPASFVALLPREPVYFVTHTPRFM